MSTFIVMVSILFITPTTVYEVADKRLWHKNPAHEMQMPIPQETKSQNNAAFVKWIESSRSADSSPANRPRQMAGSTEKVFVYRTGVQRLRSSIPETRNLP